jgi:hypothetical protein
MSDHVPAARRLERPLEQPAAAVVEATGVTAGAARDPCCRLPWLLDSSKLPEVRLESTQPSRIYSTINQQDTRQSRRKPRANDVAWQVARLTLETAASVGGGSDDGQKNGSKRASLPEGTESESNSSCLSCGSDSLGAHSNLQLYSTSPLSNRIVLLSIHCPCTCSVYSHIVRLGCYIIAC